MTRTSAKEEVCVNQPPTPRWLSARVRTQFALGWVIRLLRAAQCGRKIDSVVVALTHSFPAKAQA